MRYHRKTSGGFVRHAGAARYDKRRGARPLLAQSMSGVVHPSPPPRLATLGAQRARHPLTRTTVARTFRLTPEGRAARPPCVRRPCVPGISENAGQDSAISAPREDSAGVRRRDAVLSVVSEV